MQSRLDAHFDRVAAIAEAAAAARLRPPDTAPLVAASEYVAAIELAHRRMQQRLDAERAAVTDHLDSLRIELRQVEARLRAASEDAALHANRENQVRLELNRAVTELEALKRLRVLRLLRPARSLYARLRGHRL